MMRYATLLLITAAFFLTACVTEESARKHDLQGIFDEKPTEVPVIVPKANDARLDIADPCFTNLENIVGSLLVYYSKYNTLPESLEQISKTALNGEAITLSCPGSGKPYVYFAQGFQAPKVFDLLILFDSAPAHKSFVLDERGVRHEVIIRYGVVMEPPRPNAPVKMFVIPVQQALLDYYLQSPQPMRSQPFAQPRG